MIIEKVIIFLRGEMRTQQQTAVDDNFCSRQYNWMHPTPGKSLHRQYRPDLLCGLSAAFWPIFPFPFLLLRVKDDPNGNSSS